MRPACATLNSNFYSCSSLHNLRLQLEAKLRVNQRAAEEARARELLSKRISEKRERVTAMEGYKEAMLKEMLVLRQRIKREEEALKVKARQMFNALLCSVLRYTNVGLD